MNDLNPAAALASVDREIDAALSSALEANPLAHAVMRAHFPLQVPPVNTEIGLDQLAIETEALIDLAANPGHAAIMKLRFPKPALA